VIPNGLIGNARVTNESGGGSKKHRFHIEVCVAYGSNVSEVREILESCGIDLKGVAKTPAPRATFARMGDSALHFKLLVWLNSSVHLENVRDALNTMVYEKLNERGVAIPFPQVQVHLPEPTPKAD
jgi:small-conductance mechanosensitive channel